MAQERIAALESVFAGQPFYSGVAERFREEIPVCPTPCRRGLTLGRRSN